MKTFICTLIVIALISCGFRNDPLPTTPTADNPCGASYVPCLDMDGKYNHMCCWQHYTCGGGKYSVGCGEGECCFIGGGTGTYGASPQPNRPQFRAPE